MKVIVVAGTGTEVGKTYVAAAVIHALREQGHTVIARKPAQSFDAADASTDATVLGAASGEHPETVCPKHRWYPVPMAPPMAARALGRDPFSALDLAFETTESLTRADADVVLVETAGGAWSPQASDGDHAGDFADHLGADAVLLVADAGLGVIHAVRGAMQAFDRAARPVVVFLNRYDRHDGLHVENRAWLSQHDHFTVETSIAETASLLFAL